MGKIGALIPIRLASERLPNKAISEICGRPVVYHLLDRVCASKYMKRKDQVVVCTTREKSDDRLAELVQAYGASVFRGSTDDIIERFYHAMETFDFDAVIQVDGDDPLCETLYMDLTMEKLLGDPSLGIVTCEGLPLGIASKSFTRRAMQTVFEHYKTVQNDTGFIYFFTKTGLCKQATVSPLVAGHVHETVRLTLDYAEDFELFTRIFKALYIEGQVFGLDQVLGLVGEDPGLLEINGNLNEEYWQRTREKTQLSYVDSKGQVMRI